MSVIRNPKGQGKSYIEHTTAKQGKSWKAQLRNVIDATIPLAKDFEDFILLMERQGYKVKRQNKNISFCTDGRERFMRSKTLGADYTIKALKNRIDGKSTHKSINFIIDIKNCIKAQENKGYEHWAKINNLKQAAKTLNFLTEHNLTTYENLEKVAEQKQKSFTGISDKIKSVEKEINSTAMLIKNIETYSRLKPIMQKRKTAKDKESLYTEYKKAKAEATEIDIVKSNVDSLLGASHKPSRDISAHLEQ